MAGPGLVSDGWICDGWPCDDWTCAGWTYGGRACDGLWYWGGTPHCYYNWLVHGWHTALLLRFTTTRLVADDKGGQSEER